ncbi:hypothetical protein AALP_AA1G096400 [Arabis alpina]|uniref:S-protein homolog n=1 Tax=Arabis alpina TaxID=50452 RepID=A0A087HM71_ARAAL|nr:hypothetical protein AALP_AA1G096400 [Arabis alpina]
MLVITMYFGLNEAKIYWGCPKNSLVIQNQLGPGRILKYRCSSGDKDIVMGYLEFNTSKLIRFGESLSSRTLWKCVLEQGLWMSYSRKFIAYRGANLHRCAQVRKWIGKTDGIYFEKNLIKPPALALAWIKR